MKPDHNDDLNYLASLGREMMQAGDHDLSRFRSRFDQRTSWLARYGSTLLSLSAGAIIGLVVFILFFKETPSSLELKEEKSASDFVTQPVTPREIQNDTIVIRPENFILKTNQPKADQHSKDTAAYTDPAITSITPDLSSVLSTGFSEQKLKYIINSPVFYVQDLKVTEYTTLYFRNQKFVDLGGTPASSIEKNSAASKTRYINSARIYLHEELEAALKEFKKGDYKRCLYLLGNIQQYNKVDLNCSFYSGMCYYYLGYHLQAIPYFDACINSSNNCYLEEAQFYKARSLYESGNKDAARRLFVEISEMDGFYNEKARMYLK